MTTIRKWTPAQKFAAVLAALIFLVHLGIGVTWGSPFPCHGAAQRYLMGPDSALAAILDGRDITGRTALAQHLDRTIGVPACYGVALGLSDQE